MKMPLCMKKSLKYEKVIIRSRLNLPEGFSFSMLLSLSLYIKIYIYRSPSLIYARIFLDNILPGRLRSQFRKQPSSIGSENSNKNRI